MKKWKLIATEALATATRCRHRVAALEEHVANLETRMSKMKEQIDQRFNDIDAETNAIAAEVQNLKAQVSGGLTPDEAADVVAKMDGIAQRLTVIAQDPTNPVPTPADTATGGTGTDTLAGTGGGA